MTHGDTSAQRFVGAPLQRSPTPGDPALCSVELRTGCPSSRPSREALDRQQGPLDPAGGNQRNAPIAIDKRTARFLFIDPLIEHYIIRGRASRGERHAMTLHQMSRGPRVGTRSRARDDTISSIVA